MKEEKDIFETDNTTLFDEMIFIADEMKKAKEFIQEKEQETAEMTRDCSILARELFISRLAHKNDFSNFEMRIAVYLLNGDAGELAITDKFYVLKTLLEIYRKVSFIIGDVIDEKAKGEKTNGK